VELAIGDTGKGISPEDMNRIFEPYYTSKEKGSGIGLMIVDRIVREHGAELSVDSAPEKGAVFTIRFPRQNRRMRVLPEPQDDHLINADWKESGE
jgi:signal transduction histidine kinase